MALVLVPPSLKRLPGYFDALTRGWEPDNVRGAAAAVEQCEAIARDAAGFVARQDDPHALAGPVTLPDGSAVPRLPGIVRWMWDGAFCGRIGLRWQPGTDALPPHVLGHMGFAVVEWKRGHGHAAEAIRLMLPEARERGLGQVELTTDLTNRASQRSIERAGGTLVERFVKGAAFGGGEALRYRIVLD